MTAAIAVAFAAIIAVVALPFTAAIGAAIAAAACALIVGGLAMRQIGGQTGDVLGAAEQVAETAILLLLAGWART